MLVIKQHQSSNTSAFARTEMKVTSLSFHWLGSKSDRYWYPIAEAAWQFPHFNPSKFFFKTGSWFSWYHQFSIPGFHSRSRSRWKTWSGSIVIRFSFCNRILFFRQNRIPIFIFKSEGDWKTVSQTKLQTEYKIGSRFLNENRSAILILKSDRDFQFQTGSRFLNPDRDHDPNRIPDRINLDPILMIKSDPDL